jgi:hypothetical protein
MEASGGTVNGDSAPDWRQDRASEERSFSERMGYWRGTPVLQRLGLYRITGRHAILVDIPQTRSYKSNQVHSALPKEHPVVGERMRLFRRSSWIERALMACWIALGTTLLSTSAGAQSQSPSYQLRPVTLDAAGGRGVSATKQANQSFGQELVVGTSASPHFVVQSGFWSFLGSTLVPVVLAANKTPAQAGSVDLGWSGNNASYNLYRNTNCASVFSSAFVATSNNTYTDSSAPTSGLTCYNVLAFAPGPVPPPLGFAAP